MTRLDHETARSVVDRLQAEESQATGRGGWSTSGYRPGQLTTGQDDIVGELRDPADATMVARIRNAWPDILTDWRTRLERHAPTPGGPPGVGACRACPGTPAWPCTEIESVLELLAHH